MDKYRVLNVYINGMNLKRIQAIKDFSDVKTGDLGGYIENPMNLSQDDESWIYDEAIVLGSSVVKNNSKIKGFSICKNSKVSNSQLNDNCYLENSDIISSVVYGNAIIKDGILTGTAVGNDVIIKNSSFSKWTIYGKTTLNNISCAPKNIEINNANLQGAYSVILLLVSEFLSRKINKLKGLLGFKYVYYKKIKFN